MRTYKWREDAPKPPVEADIFGSEIERIEARDKEVKPDAVVEAARDPASPLHAAFLWHDADAAHNFRVDQARRWLRSLIVVRVEITEGHGLGQRAFHAVRASPNGHLAYQPADKVMSSRDMRRQVIEQARKDLEAYARRYGAILQGSVAWPQIEAALQAIADEADLLAAQATAAPASRRRAARNTAEQVARP